MPTGPIRRGRSGRGPMSRRRHGVGHHQRVHCARPADDQRPGDRAARQQPRRLLRRFRHDLARGGARPHAGKPVVVSMGDVAASGGYFISMAADPIVAQPGTITGSIGVITGKPVLGELLGRAGVTTDSVTEGAHSDDVQARPARSARTSGRWSTTGSTTSTPTSPARSPSGRRMTARPGPRAGQGTRVDRRRRARQRPGGRARRPGPGRCDRAPPRRPARRRAAAHLPASHAVRAAAPVRRPCRGPGPPAPRCSPRPGAGGRLAARSACRRTGR